MTEKLLFDDEESARKALVQLLSQLEHERFCLARARRRVSGFKKLIEGVITAYPEAEKALPPEWNR